MRNRPTVIICPGGAYRWLSPRESEPVARAFEALGCDTEILNYRVLAENEAGPLGLTPVRQLSERVARVRERSSGAPVFVCGFSAGGHLAATLGVHWRTLGLERPDGLILCYPVITAEPGLCNAQSIENIAGAGDRAFFSLENHVSPDTPPTFLWHTAADESVPVENALRFAAALKKAGVPFELHIYPFGGHGLSLATPEVAEPNANRMADAHVAGWIRECGEWIEQMLSVCTGCRLEKDPSPRS